MSRLLNLLLAPLIVIAAVTAVIAMVRAKPTPQSRMPAPAVPRVEVLESSPTTGTPVVRSYGNTRTHFEARIASQVGGRVLEVSPGFEPGRGVAAGALLVRIDPADFRATVAEREGSLAGAQQLLAEESARSQLAREDWLATGRRLAEASDFVLRKPQLAAAEASVAAAAAALDKARLDLERTEVRAPFDAIVGARATSPGNVVAAGTELGTLIDRRRSEVRLPLTPQQAQLLDLPLAFSDRGEGDPLAATLTTPTRPGASWQALITRTEPAVDDRNQVIYVIAEIADPFEDPDAFLPVGAFVDALIPAPPVAGVHQLPESALVRDRFVWTVDADGRLRRQPVELVFSDDDFLLVRIDGDAGGRTLRVAARPLASFEDGQQVMPLVAGTEPPHPAPEDAAPRAGDAPAGEPRPAGRGS